MPTASTIHQEAAFRRERDYPSPVTGPALVARYADAVEAVILYRAACGRVVADTGFDTVEHGIAWHKAQQAEIDLGKLKTTLAAADQITRVAAREAALARCEETSAGIVVDAFTVAAKNQMRAAMMSGLGNASAAAE